MIRDLAYSVVMSFLHGYNFSIYLLYSAINTVISLKKFTRQKFKEGDILVDPSEEDTKLRSWDIKVYNENWYARIAAYRTMGLGESYMEGWWDVGSVEELFYRIFSHNLHYHFFNRFYRLLDYLQFNLFNLQTEARSWEVGEKHYDQGNSLFAAMLDKTMNYSCGYWKTAKDLDQAQQDKMDLIARKLKLEPGMRVLDIGCGWGALCKYLAEHYDVKVVGCTISVEGAKAAQETCKHLPTAEFRVTDYRDLDEKFDRIVSVGMFEHVGHSNYRTFFEVANRCLTDDGLLLLHTIGMNHANTPVIEPWYNTYIFPNGILPYHFQIAKHSYGLFILEDWQNIGHHYYKTLMAWLDKFNQNWPNIRQNYKEPEKFYRMWTYYLQVSAAAFRSRRYQCWQVVMSKQGVLGGYDAPR